MKKTLDYCILPEEHLPKVNDFTLEYTLATNPIAPSEREVLTDSAIVLDNSLIEVLTSQITIDSPPAVQPHTSKNIATHKHSEEIAYEIPVNTSEGYEMLTIEQESQEVQSFTKHADQYSTTINNRTYSLSYSSINNSTYIVLHPSAAPDAPGTTYTITKSYTMRKGKPAGQASHQSAS